jgi:signal transduction histidine kinase
MALTPEILIPRIGDVLVEQGLISETQLTDALKKQKELRETNGEAPLLGQILVQMGMIDQDTLNQAITRQVLTLQNNLIKANETLEQRVIERTRELEQAYKKLAELSALKTNFISNISHELRTPMTHIEGYVELLLNNGLGDLSPDQMEAMRVVKKASQRLERLIEDLILFTTSEANKLVLEKTQFNITPVIIDAEERLAEFARSKEIQLGTRLPTENLTVFADKNKVSWVVHQLMENAVKFTPEGGKVVLAVEANPKAVKISVLDTGIGIAPDKLTEIFEPFHQLDGSSTRKQGGTGLGLSLAQTIISAHQSKIIVESVPGKGSSFSFELPATPEAVA